jgi:hypothetical protein
LIGVVGEGGFRELKGSGCLGIKEHG